MNRTELPPGQSVQDSTVPQGPIDFDSPWIETFYRECGREVSLAYTTLNQMKNWAMAILAASISGAIALAKISSESGASTNVLASISVLTTAVITYVFNLRFMMRAILCYINLIRWNTLQSHIISLKIAQAPPRSGMTLLTVAQLQSRIEVSIRDYYHGWLSPVERKSQVFANLKLGFALFLTLPLFFVIVGCANLWTNPFAKALCALSIGSTLVEFTEFARSRYFDTPERFARRRCGSAVTSPVFPVPTVNSLYVFMWILTLLISVAIALWQTIRPAIESWFSIGGC